MEFLANLINGMSLGSVYAIIALGYTMVYGIAKMLNFAHGDIIMVGAYICFCAVSYLGLPVIAGILLSVVGCTVLGIVIERLAYKPLRSAPSLNVLITAIGVSYFLQNAALIIMGSDPKSFSMILSLPALHLFDGRLTISATAVITILACVAIMVALTMFTGRTKMGKAMRACSEDRDAAQLMGINVNSTISMVFAIGSGPSRACSCAPPIPRSCPRPDLCPASRPSPRRCSAASAPSRARRSAACCSASSRSSRAPTSARSSPTPWCSPSSS